MVKNLSKDTKEKLNGFFETIQQVKQEKLTVQDICLISIAESLTILAEKIGKKLP